jgi:Ca-activated chloride channel homolog
MKQILIATLLVSLTACGGRNYKLESADHRAAPMERWEESEAMPVRDPEPDPAPEVNTEAYEDHGVSGFEDPAFDAQSTFSIDVDTASYAIARRKINEGTLPPQAAVRVEEFVNYFKYDYAAPDGEVPFAVNFEAAPSPFDPGTHFVRVGIQGEKIDEETRQPIHLVFLVDTSGSMKSADKIGLLKSSLRVLVNNLQDGDSVALATYAGSTSKVLGPTSVRHRERILAAIDRLDAGGSTAMSSGLELAYQMAYENLDPNATTRVIVCSDGDANVGPRSHGDILDRIHHFTQEGVTLSVIGFGMGNYKDALMEQLADQGNGNYYYIDDFKQAVRVFEDDLMGTLVVIAKDVKIQVTFDPAEVKGYRLVGYENRDIADEDFRKDHVDAGEIGAGHQVTALYEVEFRDGAHFEKALTVRIRHKAPDAGRARETAYQLDGRDLHKDFDETSGDFKLALSASSFAEILRDSPHAGEWSLSDVRRVLKASGRDDEDARELGGLIDRAAALRGYSRR